MFPETLAKKWIVAIVALLLIVFAAEMLLSVRQESQTFDESAHIYAGYSYWKRGDFGVNPEHPPLAKLIATLPLLPTGFADPPVPKIFFRVASAVGGQQLLYSHNADALLFRCRAAICIFALALGLLVFLAADEMFGPGAALFALALFVFSPIILANGALVATDMAITCCLFAAVYAFYRYVRQPSVLRLIICGVVTGLALAVKHSGILIFPIFALLAAAEVIRHRARADSTDAETRKPETRPRQALRLVGALAAISVISVTVLWSTYGFRYKAFPGNLQIIPAPAAYLKTMHRPLPAALIGFAERHHLLPEAYLFGLTDIGIITHRGRPAFLLGKLYPSGRWFYFPVAFLIKSTLAFLLLLGLLVAAKRLRSGELRREVLFTAIPPAAYFAIALTSKLDIGIRHILPIYPFLFVLVGAGAWSLTKQSRRWAYAVAILLVFHVVSSVRAYPNYLPFSNVAWGGPSNTHKVLSDSNVGWSDGLRAVESYTVTHHITKCWFAYDGPVNPDYYHIPCSPLPTLFSLLIGRKQDGVPTELQGPVFLSSHVLTGFDFGPEDMNPYEQFVKLRPAAVLKGEILVFNGSYSVTKISALSHFAMAVQFQREDHPDQALAEAKTSEALNPVFRFTHQMLASLYAKKKDREDALREYQAALHVYQTVHPAFEKFGPPPQNPLAKK